MNKQEVYRFLNGKGINYEITEHKAVFNMAEFSQVELPYPQADAKSLFIRDDKRENYYLITVKGDKRVNLSGFRKKHGTRPLTFASSEDLFNLLKLIPGAVTPLGLLDNKEKNIAFYLDSYFKDKIIGVHPNDNTATVWLKSKDLVDIIKENGNRFCWVDI